ncbi:MAG TPA: acetate kinase [Halanaerobiales bacterium]|nr:acetate kinase [Halanaerobiales bacterium]HPZ62390.1 acetate kinase [Halanaerobiales bacterium]HQD03788.1 acetate kinase [Halanaerobiales bacterium]
MIILVINSGSSSIKYQLFNMEEEIVVAKGGIQRIGIANSFLEHETHEGKETRIDQDIPDHAAGIRLMMDVLLDEEYGVINDIDEIDAVGHRVLHGGEKFTESIIIDEEVVKIIEEYCDLGPLHNPHNLTGIRVCKKLMPDKPQVAVFDTSFHTTMPEKAYLYALPYEYYEKYKVKRYGFHGTSHRYVSRRCAQLMNRPYEELKIISCHLGNGASIAAVANGKCVDTSMGLTPLEGLVMGTRCGDIDPAIIKFIMEKEGLTIEEMDIIMNKKSGLLGISGISNDSRDVSEAAKNGNYRAKLALELFDYRIVKYIGAYMAAMGGVDAIVFTAGIGENQFETRANIIEQLGFLGIKLDPEANKVRGEEKEISTADSTVKVFVIPTNEELMIARDTLALI